MPRPTLTTLLPLVLISTFVMVGCAPSASNDGASTGGETPTDAGSSEGGSEGSLDCSGVTVEGYDLFLDPALSVEPALDVYPLEAGDTITFTYSAHDEDAYPSYGWTSSYITGSGEVAPSTGSFFFDEEGGVFTFQGPEAVGGVDGGPYAGFLDIETTIDTTTTVIGRICVQFALTE